MADAGLFIGWGQVVRGREGRAVDGFNEFVEFTGQLQADGRIEDFEICFLDPHGGDLAGFMLLRGSLEQMDALSDDDEFLRHMTRADTSRTSGSSGPRSATASHAGWRSTRRRSARSHRRCRRMAAAAP